MKTNLNITNIILSNFKNYFLKRLSIHNLDLLKIIIKARLTRQKAYNKIIKLGAKSKITTVAEIGLNRLALATTDRNILIFSTCKPFNHLYTLDTFNSLPDAHSLNLCGLYNNYFAASDNATVRVWKPDNHSYKLVKTINEPVWDLRIWLAAVDEYLVTIPYKDRAGYVNFYNIAKDFEMKTVYKIKEDHPDYLHVMRDKSLLMICEEIIVVISGKKPYKLKLNEDLCFALDYHYSFNIPKDCIYEYTFNKKGRVRFPLYNEFFEKNKTDQFIDLDKEYDYDDIDYVVRLQDMRYIVTRVDNISKLKCLYIYDEDIRHKKEVFKAKNILDIYIMKDERIVVTTNEDTYLII
jgi:hypothetical protein